jgi:Spy/CpxP family protein refolding chaperone
MNYRFVVAIVAALLLSMQAAAQDRPMREGPGRMIEQLNLNDEQQKQFDALASDFRKGAVDRRAEIAKARLELLDLLKADNPDQGKIAKQMGTISSLESASKTKALDHWFAVSKILTAEQQKVWKKHLVMMAENRMGEGQMRGPRGMSRHMGSCCDMQPPQ